MQIANQSLRLFADSMAKCLSSGMLPKKSLELCGGALRSKALGAILQIAQKRCDEGMPLAEALEPAARVFPHYFIPVVRAGETSGRLVEAFQLLSDYSHRLGPTVKLVRNTWLYPLVCIVFGWVIRTGVFVYFGKYAAAWQFFSYTFGFAALLVLAGWCLSRIQPVRKLVDHVLLQLPIVRETEIRLAIVLFFSTFRLAYEAGGLGVVVMFDLAWHTVRNRAIRQDLLPVRRVLEENGSFGEAFARPALLEDDFKGVINTGSLSGHLDRSLNQIVETATQQLEFTLQVFNQFFQRLVAFSVAMAIVETVLVCVLF